MNSGEFKASKEGGGGFNPTERLLELLMKGSPTIPQVQELIKQNANVNKCDEAGRGAALIWAVVKGVKLEVLEILLKASGTCFNSLSLSLLCLCALTRTHTHTQMIWDLHVFKIIIKT